jgi:cold shock CspA family protein
MGEMQYGDIETVRLHMNTQKVRTKAFPEKWLRYLGFSDEENTARDVFVRITAVEGGKLLMERCSVTLGQGIKTTQSKSPKSEPMVEKIDFSSEPLEKVNPVEAPAVQIKPEQV